MKKTHQATFSHHFDITAWQFLPDSPIPVWVAQKFHNVGNPEVWEGLSKEGEIVKLHHTDWVLFIEDEGIMVLTNSQFKPNFKPL